MFMQCNLKSGQFALGRKGQNPTILLAMPPSRVGVNGLGRARPEVLQNTRGKCAERFCIYYLTELLLIDYILSFGFTLLIELYIILWIYIVDRFIAQLRSFSGFSVECLRNVRIFYTVVYRKELAGRVGDPFQWGFSCQKGVGVPFSSPTDIFVAGAPDFS